MHQSRIISITNSFSLIFFHSAFLFLNLSKMWNVWFPTTDVHETAWIVKYTKVVNTWENKFDIQLLNPQSTHPSYLDL